MFGTKSQSGDRYNGAYSRSGPGYALEDRSKMSRRTQNGHNTTQIEGGEDVMVASPSGHSDKTGIMMTTEMEVRWYGTRQVNDGSSTESLMQPVK